MTKSRGPQSALERPSQVGHDIFHPSDVAHVARWIHFFSLLTGSRGTERTVVMDKSKGVPVISVKTSGSKERVSISTYSMLDAPGIPGQWSLREVCCILECRELVLLL